jgi:CheY-like chemotaxis protein
MNPLHIVILDDQGLVSTMLCWPLRDLGVGATGEATDVVEALRLCGALSADLLLCNLSLSQHDCHVLLNRVAMLSHPPAVAFFGTGSHIAQIESQCVELGLRYLGLLTLPLNAGRLGRMLRQVQASHPPESQS